MPAIIVRWPSLLPQIREILGGRLTDRRFVNALEGVAEDVEAVDHQIVGQRPAGRDLKRVVGRSFVRFVVSDLSQNSRIVRTAGVDAGLRRAGSGRIRG